VGEAPFRGPERDTLAGVLRVPDAGGVPPWFDIAVSIRAAYSGGVMPWQVARYSPRCCQVIGFAAIV
jgi:hypothetical protein